MNKDALNKIEMKNDGHDLERFHALVSKVVSVPKKEIEKKEREGKDRKQKA